MKKWLSLTLALLMAMSLLAGCGGASKENGSVSSNLSADIAPMEDRAEISYSEASSGSGVTVLPENQKNGPQSMAGCRNRRYDRAVIPG